MPITTQHTSSHSNQALFGLDSLAALSLYFEQHVQSYPPHSVSCGPFRLILRD